VYRSRREGTHGFVTHPLPLVARELRVLHPGEPAFLHGAVSRLLPTNISWTELRRTTPDIPSEPIPTTPADQLPHYLIYILTTSLAVTTSDNTFLPHTAKANMSNIREKLKRKLSMHDKNGMSGYLPHVRM